MPPSPSAWVRALDASVVVELGVRFDVVTRALLAGARAVDGRVWESTARRGDRLYNFPQLAVTLERVRDNFHRYGLLDDQVRFLKGWFRIRYPPRRIERLAVMRLDGDLYESTLQALECLYDRLSVGGYVIIDDYGNIAACRQAVHDFRNQRAIKDPIRPIDWAGVYWRRTQPGGGSAG